MRDAYLWSALNPESSAERNFHASELCCVEHSDWFGKNKDPSIDFCFYKKITRTIRALPSFQIFFIVCKINFSNQRLIWSTPCQDGGECRLWCEKILHIGAAACKNKSQSKNSWQCVSEFFWILGFLSETKFSFIFGKWCLSLCVRQFNIKVQQTKLHIQPICGMCTQL